MNSEFFAVTSNAFRPCARRCLPTSHAAAVLSSTVQ